MMACRIAGLLAAFSVAAGCSFINSIAPGHHAASPPTSRPVVASTPSVQPTTRSVVPATQPASPAANAISKAELRHKAAAYLQSIQPLLTARTQVNPAAPRPTDTTPVAAGLSAVSDSNIAGCLNPDELRLNATPPAAVIAKPSSTPIPASPVNRIPSPPVAAVTRVTPAPSTDSLERRIAEQVKTLPHDLSSHLDYQLLQLLQDQPVPQISTIAPLAAEDREVLMALMDGLSNLRAAARGENNPLLSKKIRPILDMADRIRNVADLNIPTFALCRRVDGFGVYEPIPSDRLAAGREHPLILYCEVENFSSRINENKQWETKLSQDAVLYTETGKIVWQDRTRWIVDQSRNRRHDFFIARTITLPSTVPAGKHLLKVTIIDQQVRRIAEAGVSVQLVNK